MRCMNPKCRWHKVEPWIANLIMQKKFSIIIDVSYDFQEEFDLWELAQHA